MPISGLVITYNEEINIGKCIDALFQVCDEVIIVDSMSSDKTIEIAKSKGAIENWLCKASAISLFVTEPIKCPFAPILCLIVNFVAFI